MSQFGAVSCEGGVRFTVWAPEARELRLLIRNADGEHATSLDRSASGIWTVTVGTAQAGDRYAYTLDGGEPRPDPASRFQPDGVHGWSEVVDPRQFAWTDGAWRGIDPRDAAIYELHVGTFSPEGTYRGVISKLPYLRDLGITAIELMPLADFAGSRNWGYDGVCLFAPSRAYGTPDDLRALVDAAHALGLAVLIDVVYNHLGPEGAYLPLFSGRFLTARHETPWGRAVNLDDEGSEIVRALLVANARHWIEEYHADGLRLDATHALVDGRPRHFVAELTDTLRRSTRHVLVYAEDHRNLNTIVQDAARGGWDLDGIWADDFHHVVRRMLAGDEYAYFRDFDGSAEELASVLRNGWLYCGQHSKHHDAPRGTDATAVEMRRAVVCIQNHDQIGNRAFGDRLHDGLDPAAYRAAVAVLLASPMTPLLFMGQEWAASTPFQFFTDFEPGLGQLVVEGRRHEFSAFPEFSKPGATERIPDPQACGTFRASRLRWSEQVLPFHAGILALHRALLGFRSAYACLRGSDATSCDARALDAGTVAFVRPETGSTGGILVCARLTGAGRVRIPDDMGPGAWTPLLTTEDGDYVASPERPAIEAQGRSIRFTRPGAVLVRYDG